MQLSVSPAAATPPVPATEWAITETSALQTLTTEVPVIYTKDNQMEADKWGIEGKNDWSLQPAWQRCRTPRPTLLSWVNLQQDEEEARSPAGISSLTWWISAPSWCGICPSTQTPLSCAGKVQRQTAKYCQSGYSPSGKNVISAKFWLLVGISQFQWHFVQTISYELTESCWNWIILTFLWETVAWILSAYKINWSIWTFIKIKCFDCLQAIFLLNITLLWKFWNSLFCFILKYKCI